MKTLSITIISAGLLTTSMIAMSASSQPAVEVFKDKAISYAVQYEKNANFDLHAASRELSQNAQALGKIYGSGYQVTPNDITSEQCLEEVAKLGLDSQTFVNKA